MVIGDLGLRSLSKLLFGIQEKIGREVNPHVLSEDEFRKRVEKKEHFVSSLMKGPRIFIIGSEHDLEAVG